AEPARPDGVSPKLARALGSLALSLALTDDEKRLIEAELMGGSGGGGGGDSSGSAASQLIHPSDEISLRTHFLKKNQYFVPRDAELSMLNKIGPLAQLRPPPLDETEWPTGGWPELLFFCSQGGLSYTDIDHAFKQFVFECLHLTSTDPGGFVLDGDAASAASVIPWDDPYPFFAGLRDVYANEEAELASLASASAMESA
uniref:Rab3 GTPase-activating protein catalytic subunit n=1 Tax=Macrostomum lignano TaxID=282301 RepID=A0A1I8HYL0_9PLAT